jgi:hypothetical protein
VFFETKTKEISRGCNWNSETLEPWNFETLSLFFPHKSINDAKNYFPIFFEAFE